MRPTIKILLVAIIGFLFANVNAQNSGFSIKAGVNFNNISGDNAPSVAKVNTGYHLGVAYEVSFSEYFGLEPALF